MAHRGEEGTLRLRRRLGFLPRALELGDVVVDRVEADAVPVEPQRDELHLDVQERAILGGTASDATSPTLPECLQGDVAALAPELRRDDELVDGLPHRFVRGVAEEPRSGGVPARHPLVGIHHDDGCRADLDEHLEVLLLAVYLGEQARVLDRDADVGGDGGEEARVGLAEPAFLLDALDADYADRPVAGEDRHAEIRERGRSDCGLSLVLLPPVEQQRLARAEDLRCQPLAVLDGWLRAALARLVVVGELDPPRLLVVQGHIRDVGVERPTHLLADELDQCVEVELRRERLADAVHGSQLGDALPRLVDEARVVEGDAEASGQRGQEPLVVRVERMRAVDVLERKHARRASADEQRDEDRRLARISADDRRVAVTLELPPDQSTSSSSGSRDSITCLRKPISGIGCSSSRSPRSRM